jgi:hypothetical protein
MAYALVQKELIIPELDQLKRAFGQIPRFTSLDAQTAANDDYGILWRGLDADEGQALQAALLQEQLETELVEESKLPVIPPAKIVKQMEFHQTHLTLYDPMQRAFEVPWQEISFIAAGYVKMRDIRKQRSAIDEVTLHGHGAGPEKAGGGKGRETESPHLLLDIFLNEGATRYSMTADDFAFDHLGAGMSDDPAINFVALVDDLAEQAPQAALNRGAYLACQDPPELFPYPSKAAFNEEITWMLWRIRQIEGSSGEGI